MELRPDELKELMHSVVDGLRLEVRRAVRRSLLWIFGTFAIVVFVLPVIFPQLDFCRIQQELDDYQVILEVSK